MKRLPIIFFLLISTSVLKGQESQEIREGTVTYITSQSVYIKFSTTRDIEPGDTIYIQSGQTLVPALQVRYLSSISAACTNFSNLKFTLSDKVYYKGAGRQNTHPSNVEPVRETPKEPAQRQESLKAVLPDKKSRQPDIRGYLSMASNLLFSPEALNRSQRMQYIFSLTARDLANSSLSLESYISFRHKFGKWNEVKENIFNGLKIYNLALGYGFSNKLTVTAGRKINYKFSNLGASDGLQAEMKFKPLVVGILAGTRPDYTDYGFNGKLFQAGGYLYNEISSRNGPVQNTLAFIEQTNSGKTDRRYAYLQHYNAVIPRLNFFGSAEIDLYKKEPIPPDTIKATDTTYKISHKPVFSAIYLSLRYRASGKLNFSVSYSARQQIIFYETYKNFLDQLLQEETRKGYFLQANYRPSAKLNLGINAGYNFQKADPRTTRNLNLYITYVQLPIVDISVTLSSIFLQTAYISGNIYRVDLSRDIIPGKLYGGINYSYVKYTFYNEIPSLPQNIAEANLSWRIFNKLSFSAYYEGTFEKQGNYHNLYLQLMSRF